MPSCSHPPKLRSLVCSSEQVLHSALVFRFLRSSIDVQRSQQCFRVLTTCLFDGLLPPSQTLLTDVNVFFLALDADNRVPTGNQSADGFAHDTGKRNENLSRLIELRW